jgi:hypothetical protein
MSLSFPKHASIFTLALSFFSAGIAKAATPTTHLCLIQYVDTGVQARPLFTERFDAKLGGGFEGIVKNFGVSPGQGGYYAYVAPNLNAPISNDTVLMIGNSTNELKSLSMASSASPLMHLQLNVSEKQTLSVTCQRSQADQ